MSDFRVKFRGVRGSFPISDRNFYQYGGNTSCVEVCVGNRLIILDAGTGIIKSGDEMMEKYISSSLEPKNRETMNVTILLSHIHQDHLLGLTFFKPLHVKGTNINLFGNCGNKTDLKTDLTNLVFGKTFPLDLGDIACNLNIRDLQKSEKIVIHSDSIAEIVPYDFQEENEDVVITYYKSYVHPQDGVMIYKITYKGKSVVYATDKECYLGGDKKFIEFANGCDVMIHDAQYTTEDYLNIYTPKQGFGHSTFDMATEAKKLSNAKSLVFFHYDPLYDDIKLNRIKEHYVTDSNNVFMAYEGLEIDVENFIVK